MRSARFWCNLLCTLSSLSKLNDDYDDDDDRQRKTRKILPHHSLVLVVRKLHGDTEKHLNVVLGIHKIITSRKETVKCVLNSEHSSFFCFLWSPYVSSSFFFSPRLISAVGDWMSTILPHMVWKSAAYRSL